MKKSQFVFSGQIVMGNIIPSGQKVIRAGFGFKVWGGKKRKLVDDQLSYFLIKVQEVPDILLELKLKLIISLILKQELSVNVNVISFLKS